MKRRPLPSPFSPSLRPPLAGAVSLCGCRPVPIKALSTQQIDDLKAGRGMGLALAR